MDIGSISTLGSGSTDTSALSSATSGAGDLGQEEFLQLLVTQMSNQDPLNPMQGQEFVAQLAQFSTVERLINIEGTMAQDVEMGALLAQSVNSGVAAGMIGKTVEASGNQIGWNGEGEASLGFDLAANADKATVTIRNEAGVAVRTMELESLSAGRQELTWDGTGDDGTTLAEGVYTFEIEATTGEDEAVAATPFVQGSVDRVTFGAEGTQLWLGPFAVWMGDVTTVQSE